MTVKVEKKLAKIQRAEERLQRQAHKEGAKWKAELEKKIPEKVSENLRRVFRKAFGIIFDKGTELIEKTFNKDEIKNEFLVRDYANGLEMSQKDLLFLNASTELSNLVSLAASAAEGIGLGALGIGLPDIVLFVSMILRGCYETALRYGFEYDSLEERYFILTVLEGAMLKGTAWDACNDLVNNMLVLLPVPSEDEMKDQLSRTSDAFAMDMLLAKFVQGIPVVGIVGGFTNPLYYRRILNYVRLKYKKRYLLLKLRG